MKAFIILFTGIPLVFMAIGAWQAVEQGRRIKGYAEADGEVVAPAAEVKSPSSTWRTRSRTYTPVVRYRYEVGGSIYRGERVFPMMKSSSPEYAGAITRAHPVGRRVKVYYNPDDPSEAFLIRRWDFLPYMFILFPMVHFSLGVGLYAGGVLGRKSGGGAAAVVNRARDGWVELPIGTGIGQKYKAWGTIAAAWWGVGPLACGHYFLLAGRAYERNAVLIGGGYLLLGGVPLFLTVRYWLMARNLADARVFVDKGEVRVGDVIHVRMEQVFYRPLLILGLDIGLVLERTDERYARGSGQTGKREIKVTNQWEAWGKDLVSNEQSTTGRPLTAKFRFEIPAGQTASSAEDAGYPKFEWRVVVRVRLDDAPDYQGAFPIQVRER